MNEVFEITPGQLVFGVLVLEAVIGDYDPRASLRIVLSLDAAMNVQHRQRLDISQRRRFDRLDRSISPLEVVLRGLLVFEERAVQGGVSGLAVLLR